MWCREKGGSVLLNIRVQPNSSKEETGEVRNDALIIRLTAPPVEGKANDALIRFLSKRLAVAKSRVTLVQGERGRNKLVAIQGLGAREAAMRLGVNP
ncbi:MAG: DUF167 domain-containing protein [Desulfobacterota bacterium]|jgi:hypothetical protein|nr:DUF167 domain-containing protein [Thermodesulfobacteriota bacterium]